MYWKLQKNNFKLIVWIAKDYKISDVTVLIFEGAFAERKRCEIDMDKLDWKRKLIVLRFKFSP